MKAKKNFRRPSPRPKGAQPPHLQSAGQGPAIPPGRWTIGLHSVREALKVRPEAVKELWLRDDWERSSDLSELGEMARRVVPKPSGLLDRLGSGHQGAAALLSSGPAFSWESVGEKRHALVILADGIQDPHNLGAILRTAWLMGASALFIPEHRSSPLTPTAMKVASGGAEHVPVISDGNLLDTAKHLKDKGFWVYGLAGEGRQTLWQVQFPEKVALVLGSEESGIRTPLARLCDELVRIPQGDAEASFNASVAAAIAMAEVVRQHAQFTKKA